MAVLYVFRGKLPFPFPQFFLVPLAFCLAHLAVRVTLVRRDMFAAAYPLLLYIDSAVAPFVFHYTGGFLSPFIISHLLTVMASGLVLGEERKLSRNAFVILVVSYAAVALLEKYSVLYCPIDYARHLMKNDMFFYFVVAMTLFIFAGAYVFLEQLRANTQQVIDELTGAFRSITKGTVSVVGENFFTSLVQNLAEALQAPSVFIAEWTENGSRLSTVAIWEKGALRHNASIRVPAALFEEINGKGGAVPESCLKKLFGPTSFHGFPHAKHLYGFALQDSLGTPVGLLCIMHDGITLNQHVLEPLSTTFASRAAAELERKRADERRKELETRLAHTQKMEALGQLAGGVAHDFGNLLTAISGYADLLSLDLAPGSQHHTYVSTMRATCGRAADLVKTIMNFAKKDAPARIAPIDLHATVRDTVVLLERSINKRIRISLSLDAPLATAPGDAALLQNALLNLGINARDAIGDNNGSIIFSTAVTAIDGSNVLCDQFKIKPGDYVPSASPIRETASPARCSRTSLNRSSRRSRRAKEPG